MAHKAFEDGADLIVEAAHTALHDEVWGGYERTVNAVFAEFVATSEDHGEGANTPADRERRLHAALKTNFEWQFRSPAVPAGWLLTAVALTASDAWELDRPSDDLVELGQALLDERRRQYETITENFVAMLGIAMTTLELRPRPGFDARTIVTLLHCLHDGAVLRHAFDPEAIDGDLLALAMLELGKALGEHGSVEDPRLPSDGTREARIAFDSLVLAALNSSSPASATVESTAAATKKPRVPLSTAQALFPSDGDLLDSMLRRRVVSGGLDPVGSDETQHVWYLGVLYSQLDALAELARAHPDLVAAASAKPPRRSAPLPHDLATTAMLRLREIGSVGNAEELANDLVRFATRGDIEVVEALLSTAGLPRGSRR